MSAALLDVSHVSKTFTRGGLFSSRRIVAVNDVSFQIDAARPEIFTIIGESGSGKTTLSRMILNIERPTSGTLVFDGIDLATVRSSAGRMAFMHKVQPIFQNPFEAFNPLKQLDRYLFMTRRRFHADGDQAAIEVAVDEALRKVGLSLKEVRRRYPHELSGGQLQRVAIARALLVQPEADRRRRAGVDGRCVAADVDRQPVQGAARRSRHLDRLCHARSCDRLLYQRPHHHHAEGQRRRKRRCESGAERAAASLFPPAARRGAVARGGRAAERQASTST